MFLNESFRTNQLSEQFINTQNSTCVHVILLKHNLCWTLLRQNFEKLEPAEAIFEFVRYSKSRAKCSWKCVWFWYSSEHFPSQFDLKLHHLVSLISICSTGYHHHPKQYTVLPSLRQSIGIVKIKALCDLSLLLEVGHPYSDFYWDVWDKFWWCCWRFKLGMEHFISPCRYCKSLWCAPDRMSLPLHQEPRQLNEKEKEGEYVCSGMQLRE